VQNDKRPLPLPFLALKRKGRQGSWLLQYCPITSALKIRALREGVNGFF